MLKYCPTFILSGKVIHMDKTTIFKDPNLQSNTFL